MDIEKGCKELGIRQSDFQELRRLVKKRFELVEQTGSSENPLVLLVNDDIRLFATWMFKDTQQISDQAKAGK